MFQPGAGGAHEGELVIRYRDHTGEQTATTTLTGVGVQPYLTLDPGSFRGGTTFGDVTVGWNRLEMLSVINSSPTDEDLIVHGVEISPADTPFTIHYLPFDEEAGQEGLNEPEVHIAKGDSWSFQIEFAPLSEWT